MELLMLTVIAGVIFKLLLMSLGRAIDRPATRVGNGYENESIDDYFARHERVPPEPAFIRRTRETMRAYEDQVASLADETSGPETETSLAREIDWSLLAHLGEKEGYGWREF